MLTFNSPAFLQQCFASHHTGLVLKQLRDPKMLIVCVTCKLRYVVTVRPQADPPAASPKEAVAVFSEPFAHCAAEHLSVMGVTAVDVTRDLMELHCAQCRKAYPFMIRECQTSAAEE